MASQDLFEVIRLTKGRFLGSGVSSQVCLATSMDNPEERYAVKMVAVSNANFEKLYDAERNILKDLQHHHIVRFVFGLRDNQTGLLVLGYYPGGTLGSRLGQIAEAQDLLRYVLEVASALEYLHLKRIYHRDVKPDNILINGDDEAVLTDFGLCGRLNDKDHSVATWSSTPTFLGPETQSGQPMSPFKVRFHDKKKFTRLFFITCENVRIKQTN